MSTKYVICPCGCGESVASTGWEWESTQVEISACSKYAAQGLRSMTMRKSAAMDLRSASAPSTYRHVDGLVTFTGVM